MHDSQAQLTEHAQQLSSAHIPHTGLIVSEWSAESVAAALEAHPEVDEEVRHKLSQCSGQACNLDAAVLSKLQGLQG